jgi:hypothetical protein
MYSLENDEQEDFVNSIKEFGLLESDFSIKETGSTNNSGGISAVQGTIEITYSPTGATKIYNTGHSSSSLAEFHSDLKLGCYKKS